MGRPNRTKPDKKSAPRRGRPRNVLTAADWAVHEPANKDELKTARVYVNFGVESGVRLDDQLVRLANRRSLPTVAGDIVYTDGKVVMGIAPRGKVLARYADEGGIRLIASHLDQVGVVVSASDPPFQESFVDRYVVYCRITELPLFIVLNKMDEAVEGIVERLAVYTAAGIDVYPVSAKRGRGMKALAERLKRGVTVLSGLSGVGKSTVINRLLGEDIPVQELTKYGRGRHTTTSSEAYDFEGTLLIDTPGIKKFGLLGVAPEQVIRGFPDLEALAGGCRWAGCLHDGESGCAIEAAVKAGTVSELRWRIYRELIASARESAAGA
jgi:ribosome biogenesis GTPase